jgi:hypothetical protein
MPGVQTNLRLTPEGRARLLKLAARVRRSPRDVVEMLIEQATVGDAPDITLGGSLPVGDPHDGA